MYKRFLLILMILFLAAGSINFVEAQKVIYLYDSIPNSKVNKNYKEKMVINRYGSRSFSKVSNPSISVFFPDKMNNKHIAMLLIPGGGYSSLAYDWEGPGIGDVLVKWGITAIVLKYRLPSDSIMIDKSIGPLQDAQRAIQLTRDSAQKWHIDPAKIGVMGFSAGGHLAAMSSVYFNEPVISNTHNISLRPDFSVLIYPVISGDSTIVSWGSRKAAIGDHPTPELINKFSVEMHVTDKTPPTFIAVAVDDKTVNPENSIWYFQSLLKNKIAAELHVYQSGGHGFTIKRHAESDEWLQNLKYWLQQNHFLQ